MTDQPTMSQSSTCLRVMADFMRPSTDGFCALDDAARVIAINPAMWRCLGLASENDAVNRSLYDLADGRLDTGEFRAFVDGGMEQPLDLRLGGEPHFVARVWGRAVEEAGGALFLLFRFESDYSRQMQRKRNEIRELAYEIRTPLASVFGFSELLLNREFTADKQREFTEIIYQEAGRLARHVEQLLHMELDTTAEDAGDNRPAD